MKTKHTIIISVLAVTTLGIWWYVKQKKKNDPKSVGNGIVDENGDPGGNQFLPGEMDTKKGDPKTTYAIAFDKIGSRPGAPHMTILKPNVDKVSIQTGDKVKVASEFSKLNGTYPVLYVYRGKDVYIKFPWPDGDTEKYVNKMVKGSFEKA